MKYQNNQVREKILMEFEKSLGESGYKKTTIQQIASICGISKGHVTFYFKKKEDFLFALFENFFARMSILMEEVKLEGNPIILFFVKQLFTFYLLDKKEDYCKKVSELSEVKAMMDFRTKIFYNDISSIFKQMNIKFDSNLLEDTCVTLSCTIYGLINYWYHKSYRKNYKYFFNIFADHFFAQNNFDNLKHNKERALELFESLDKIKLLEMYNELFEYNYIKLK